MSSFSESGIVRDYGFKIFRQNLGPGTCLAYLIWDRATKQAVVIDPQLEAMDDYRSFLLESGLKLVWALDTHTHADHCSASHLFRAEMGAKVGMSVHTQSERVTDRLKGGEVIEAGSIKLEVLATPGHTPDSLSFFWKQGCAVFTGDTLLVGSSGRTDFPGADPAAEWKSLHEVIGALPGETLIFPGHDYSELLFSTLSVEKKRNPHWLIPSQAAFVAMKNAETVTGGQADEVKAKVRYNIAANPDHRPSTFDRTSCATACGAPVEGGGQVASITVDKFKHKISGSKGPSETLFVDVRERDEYQDGHIGGTWNIPLSELGFYVRELQSKGRIYFSCQSGRRSMLASKTFAYLGMGDVVNVTGGFNAWEQNGFPVKVGS